MIAYTIQMGRWRLAEKENLTLIDTTVKSGEIKLAPTWDMVLGYKKGDIGEEDYTKQYLTLMEKSVKDNPEWWDEFLKREKVALICYCKADAFCHRLLLADFIARLCEERDFPFEYKGELVSTPTHPLKGDISVFPKH